MSPGQDLYDPVLGVLRWDPDQWGWGEEWRGSVLLTPKHSVTVVFQWRERDGTLAECLGRAREAFLRIRGNEWNYRLQTANYILMEDPAPWLSSADDDEDVGSWDAGQLARRLSLVHVKFYTNGLVNLHYDHGGLFGMLAVNTELQPDGTFGAVDY
jgi:hypothetical protein